MKKSNIMLFLIILIQTAVIAQPVEELIQKAINYSPSLKALQLDYESALMKADQVTDWPDPTVSLGLGVLPIETRLGAQRLRIGASQMIPWKGLLNAQKNVALSMANQKSNVNQLQEIEIEYAIRLSYSSLLFLDRKKQIINQKLAVIDALQELAKIATSSGKGKLSNVLLTERSRRMLEVDLSLLDTKMQQPTIAINRLMGEELTSKIELDHENSVLFSKSEILEYAHSKHPQFGIMDQQLEASNAKITLVTYQQKPKIGVGLDYAYIAKRQDADIPGNGRDVFMPMASISIPLHTGRYNAVRQEEMLKKDAIQARRQNVEESQIAEVELAYSRIEYAGQIRSKYDTLRVITIETLKLMRTEYATEGTRFEEILRLEMDLIDYDLEVLQADYERNLAQAILYKFK